MGIVIDFLDLTQKWEPGAMVLAKMHLRNIPAEGDRLDERQADGWELSIRAQRLGDAPQWLRKISYRMAKMTGGGSAEASPRVEVVEFSDIVDTMETPFGPYFVTLEQLMIESGHPLRKRAEYAFVGEPEIEMEFTDVHNFTLKFSQEARDMHGDSVLVKVIHYSSGHEDPDDEEEEEAEFDDESAEGEDFPKIEILDIYEMPGFPEKEDNEREDPYENYTFGDCSEYRVIRKEKTEHMAALLVEEIPYRWLNLYLKADRILKNTLLEFVEGEEEKGSRSELSEEELLRLRRIADHRGMQWGHSFPA